MVWMFTIFISQSLSTVSCFDHFMPIFVSRRIESSWKMYTAYRVCGSTSKVLLYFVLFSYQVESPWQYVLRQAVLRMIRSIGFFQNAGFKSANWWYESEDNRLIGHTSMLPLFFNYGLLLNEKKIWLWAGRPEFSFQRGQGFCFSPLRPYRLWGHSASCPMGTGGSFPGG